MSDDRYARYGAASGILAVILSIVGFAIFGSDIPDTDAAAQEWGSFYVDNQDQIQTGMTLFGISVFFFIWFLAVCETQSRQRRAAAPDSPRSRSAAESSRRRSS
jgi:hypothetical protein